MCKMVNYIKNWANSILNLTLTIVDFNLSLSKSWFPSDKMEIVLLLHFRGFLNVSLFILVKLLCASHFSIHAFQNVIIYIGSRMSLSS